MGAGQRDRALRPRPDPRTHRRVVPRGTRHFEARDSRTRISREEVILAGQRRIVAAWISTVTIAVGGEKRARGGVAEMRQLRLGKETE
jgi:hypothetical protein